MNLYPIICFLFVLKLSICSALEKNKKVVIQKLEQTKIPVSCNLKDFGTDNQINVGVKMNDLNFKSESVSFFFVNEEECSDTIDVKGKTKEETSPKRTFENQELIAFYYNVEKKADFQCLIIIIENDLKGELTIFNNQVYNPSNIKGYELEKEIKISPTNEPIYLLFSQSTQNHLEITFPIENEKEIIEFKKGDLKSEYIENIPYDSKFSQITWNFKYSILKNGYYYCYHQLSSSFSFGLEIPKLTNEITIKLSSKNNFNTDSYTYNNRKKFDPVNPINRVYFNIEGNKKSPFYIEITSDKNNIDLYYRYTNETAFRDEEKSFFEYIKITQFKDKKKENKTEYRLYYEINKIEDFKYINLFTKTPGINSLDIRIADDDASDFPIIQIDIPYIVKIKENKNTLVLFNAKNHNYNTIYFKFTYKITDFDLQSNYIIYIKNENQEPNEFYEFSSISSATGHLCSFSVTFENDTTICYISNNIYISDISSALYINPGNNYKTEKQIEFFITQIKEYINSSISYIKTNYTCDLYKMNYINSRNLPENEIYYIQIELPSQFKVIHTYHKYIDTKYKSCGAYKPKTTNDNTTRFYFGPINKGKTHTSADFLLDILTTNITENTKFKFLVTDVDESPNDIEPVDPLNPNPNPKPQPSDGGGGSTDKPKTNYTLIIILLVLVIVIVAFIVLFCCFRETFSKICPFLKQVNSDSIINSVKSIDENNTP